MANVIMDELERVKQEYTRPRRTVIENAEEAVFEEKKIEYGKNYFVDIISYKQLVDTN